MLEITVVITFKEEDLHPVFYLCCPQTELEGETENTRLGSPTKLLLFGMRITRGQSYRGGALHLDALVVVIVENQEGATV